MRTGTFFLTAVLTVGASLPAAAQFLPDGGALPCVQDTDCGGCGWACNTGSSDAGSCSPALGTNGSCQSSAGCACAGQTCSGSLQDNAGSFCLPNFQPQCLCDADCVKAGGGICDEVTHACHPRPTACEYLGECGCGCQCDADTATCTCTDAGLAACQYEVCFSNLLPDGGLTFGDAGFVPPAGIDGGIDAGIQVGGVFCQQVGGTCSSDVDCCSSNCVNEACACIQGSDPGEYACLVDSDCCSPATCSASGYCFLDAGVLEDAFPGNTSPPPYMGSSSNGSSSCATGGAGGSFGAVFVSLCALAQRRRRSRS